MSSVHVTRMRPDLLPLTPTWFCSQRRPLTGIRYLDCFDLALHVRQGIFPPLSPLILTIAATLPSDLESRANLLYPKIMPSSTILLNAPRLFTHS